MFKDSDSEDYMDMIDSSYTSRVAEIFEVILKSLSIGLDFIDEDNIIYPMNNIDISAYTINGKMVMCTKYQAFLLEKIFEVKEILLEENAVLLKDELLRIIEYYMNENNYLFGDTLENILGSLIDVVF